MHLTSSSLIEIKQNAAAPRLELHPQLALSSPQFRSPFRLTLSDSDLSSTSINRLSFADSLLLKVVKMLLRLVLQRKIDAMMIEEYWRSMFFYRKGLCKVVCVVAETRFCLCDVAGINFF
ncbi:unnamed protein product [Vicia faba]|uniref:Uncharacterized protein n=1 Tax=Vicia faba TaxID=3906 RepID=A0AAV1ADN9_VICFA|nr:unnamed protein product [Vicia faba]